MSFRSELPFPVQFKPPLSCARRGLTLPCRQSSLGSPSITTSEQGQPLPILLSGYFLSKLVCALIVLMNGPLRENKNIVPSSGWDAISILKNLQDSLCPPAWLVSVVLAASHNNLGSL